MTQPLTDAITALTRYANEVTGQSDTTLSDAVRTLCDGYGQGGITLADIASGEAPSGAIDITGLTFSRDYAFANFKKITAVVGEVRYLTAYAFQNCVGIETVHIVTAGGGGNIFAGCTNLKTAVFLVSTNDYPFAIFNGCRSLEIVDLRTTRLGTNTFYNCQKMSTLILRNDSSVTVFYGNPAFTMTPFKSGGTGGTLYVPQSMIESYLANSDWDTLMSYPNNQILPIEGSIYETQYADGTPIE